eukprot:18694-Heterococcus_DN1.PRE.4
MHTSSNDAACDKHWPCAGRASTLACFQRDEKGGRSSQSKDQKILLLNFCTLSSFCELAALTAPSSTMLRSFSAGSLMLDDFEADLDAEDFMASNDFAMHDSESFQLVRHFPLDTIEHRFLVNNSFTPAAAPVAPTPAQLSPAPAEDVASIEAPSTMASSNNTSSSGRYETTGSITVRNFHKQLDIYDGSTRLILAVDEHDNIIALLPAPQAGRANKRQRLTATPPLQQQPLLTAPVPAALWNLLNTAGLTASLECVREGYFRQLPKGMIVFQLRGLREEVYMSLQGPDRYTPGLTLRITLAALRGLKEAFNARASTAVWSIAGNSTQQLIFAVEL